MAQETGEVIDLLSSDDEVVVVPSNQISTSDGDRPSSSSLTGVSKKRRLYDTQGREKLPPKSEINPSTIAQEINCVGKSEIANAEHPSDLHQIVLDNDGKDNAVMTPGIMKLIDNLNLPGVLTCTSAQRRSSSQLVPSSRVSTLQHVQQNDQWSCGFRNLQMMLTAILPHLPANHAYFHVVPRRLDITTIPTLEQLQRALEQSWKAGFDPKGAQYYGHKIVGRSSKIGAVEVASVMSYWGLDSTVIQFIKCFAARSLLPKFVDAYFHKKLGKEGCPFCSVLPMRSVMGAEELLQFSSTVEQIQIEPPCDCPILPLYLQWEGHSATIVGFENGVDSQEDARLVLLDPLKNGETLKAAVSRQKTLDALTLPCTRLLKKDIQLIMCSTRSLTPPEREARRNQVSAVTAAKGAVLRATRGL